MPGSKSSPKSAEAFRTISEAANELDVPQHVLRHWEDVFGQIRPMRRAGGRRYYRPVDLDVLRGVRVLLYDERYTTKGVQKIFKHQGVKYIAELGRLAAAGEPIALRATGETRDVAELKPGEHAPTPNNPFRRQGGRGDALSPAMRQSLNSLISRLEGVQEALDEAALALEAIDIEDGGAR